jgi:hypothetical protein
MIDHVSNGKSFFSPLLFKRPIPKGQAPVILCWKRSSGRARAMEALLASSSECTQMSSIMPIKKKEATVLRTLAGVNVQRPFNHTRSH